jgi:hypothetical protein
VGGVVLGVMALVAGIGLIVALATQEERRHNDTAMKPRPGRALPPIAEPLSPSRLPALGYLPPKTNVVLGLHVAELVHTETGRKLLDQPITMGRVRLRPGQIADWCGLPREDIDHLVLGVATENAGLPVAVLILRTNRPFRPEQVRVALKGENVPLSDKKNLYKFQLENPALPMVVWCIDGRTLALALIESHLDAVPTDPRSGLDHLPEAVRTTLQKRVESGSLLWVVGAVEERTREWLDTLAPQVKRANGKLFTAVRTFAAWVQPEATVRVGAVFQCADDVTAQKIEDVFSKPILDPHSATTLAAALGQTATTPNSLLVGLTAETMLRRSNPNLKVVRLQDWVTLQYTTDLETVLQALGQ